MTKIQWTGETWNPLRGCTPASPGCANCYAARMAARNLPELNSPTTGEPFAILTENGPHWTGKVELIEDALEKPLHWRKPRRVFVNSMSDLFHESVPDEWIDRIFAVMALCPRHTFQVLTKRARRMREYIGNSLSSRCVEVFGIGTGNVRSASWITPLPNVHLIVSAEDQRRADERIPDLLATPSAVRGVSLEPLLGPIDLSRWIPTLEIERETRTAKDRYLDWVIVGGESGPGARPCRIEWIRDIVCQCREAGVACFVKQLGARPFVCIDQDGNFYRPEGIKDKKGGNREEWPDGDWPREFPKGETK